MGDTSALPNLANQDGLVRQVELFYQWIDLISTPQGICSQHRAEAIDQISEFMAQAVYYRCDRAPMRGKAIARFYREERRVIGSHSLTRLMLSDRTVLASGRLDREDGTSVRFCDLWEFDQYGRVTQRETYLATGAQLIEAGTWSSMGSRL